MFIDLEIMEDLRKLKEKDDEESKIKFNQLIGFTLQRHAIEIFNLAISECENSSNKAIFYDFEKELFIAMKYVEAKNNITKSGDLRYIKIYELKSNWTDRSNLIKNHNNEILKLKKVFIEPDITKKIQQVYLSDSEVTGISHKDRLMNYFYFLINNQVY